MEAERLEDGLWRWTGWHEEWREEVGCVYAETGDGACLIDPIVPPEDRDRFLAALDRDAERLGGRVHVLLTVHYHARGAKELAARYGARIWAPSRARAAAERRVGPIEPFRPGDALPGGTRALPTARTTEVVFHLPAYRTLVPGDVLLGGLRLCPDSWLPSGTTQDDLRASLGPLLDLDVERVLVSHGEPVRSGGAAALRELLA